jgi:ACS family glucarate transporter-like MFS transporter
VVACLLLCALGMAIPFVNSLTMVVILTIFPVSFGGTATATNAALTNDLLRSQADSGRAFAFMVLGGNVFGLLAPIVTGYIVKATDSFAAAFVLAATRWASQRQTRCSQGWQEGKIPATHDGPDQ